MVMKLNRHPLITLKLLENMHGSLSNLIYLQAVYLVRLITCYLNSRSNCDSTVANILRSQYTRPAFLPETSESSAIDWIFMGSPGYGAPLHVRYTSFLNLGIL